jgi:hypothetical protein
MYARMRKTVNGTRKATFSTEQRDQRNLRGKHHTADDEEEKGGPKREVEACEGVRGPRAHRHYANDGGHCHDDTVEEVARHTVAPRFQPVRPLRILRQSPHIREELSICLQARHQHPEKGIDDRDCETEQEKIQRTRLRSRRCFGKPTTAASEVYLRPSESDRAVRTARNSPHVHSIARPTLQAGGVSPRPLRARVSWATAMVNVTRKMTTAMVEA